MAPPPKRPGRVLALLAGVVAACGTITPASAPGTDVGASDAGVLDVVPGPTRGGGNWEGGTAAFCQALIPNPFYQVAPFTGTSYFSSPTLARSTLAAPYPQFGGITRVDANANASWSKPSMA